MLYLRASTYLRYAKYSGSQHWKTTRTAFFSTFDDDIGQNTVQHMLNISKFVYTFAELRGLVRDHDKVQGKGNSIAFHNSDLIITQQGAQPKNQNRLFKYPVTATAIRDFIRDNRCFLSQEEDGTIILDDKTKTTSGGDDVVEFPELDIEQKLGSYSEGTDSELVDFDDKFTTDGGLVYAIVKNNTNKRITVGFRGTAGLKDMINDGKFGFKRTPDIFSDNIFKPRLHRGFASYLFDDREETLEDGSTRNRTRFDRIVACLKDLYDEIPEEERDQYDVCVTGHSLGGALANIFAFALAETQADYKYFDKILAMTFAAPLVGGSSYQKAFQSLEKEGRLRYIRISNHRDIVTSKPYPRYFQNGVNLHLFSDSKMELRYGNTKNVFTQISFSPLTVHGLDEYEKRLFGIPENKEILDKKVSELYDVAGEFTKF